VNNERVCKYESVEIMNGKPIKAVFKLIEEEQKESRSSQFIIIGNPFINLTLGGCRKEESPYDYHAIGVNNHGQWICSFENFGFKHISTNDDIRGIHIVTEVWRITGSLLPYVPFKIDW